MARRNSGTGFHDVCPRVHGIMRRNASGWTFYLGQHLRPCPCRLQGNGPLLGGGTFRRQPHHHSRFSHHDKKPRLPDRRKSKQDRNTKSRQQVLHLCGRSTGSCRYRATAPLIPFSSPCSGSRQTSVHDRSRNSRRVPLPRCEPVRVQPARHWLPGESTRTPPALGLVGFAWISTMPCDETEPRSIYPALLVYSSRI